MISISIVSHGQRELLGSVLGDLGRFAEQVPFEIILTLNVPESLPVGIETLPFPIRIIRNDVPKGFGANHNAALHNAEGQWFCVMNPDIRIPESPFNTLLKAIECNQGAVIAPTTVSMQGQVEDSVRHFPTLLGLIAKALGKGDGRYVFSPGAATFEADWVGGMFMLFRAEDYRRIGGFDEGFFLYYEDVDICTRLWAAGGKVLACPQASVIHDARRTSRRHLRYMRWHLASMTRYFCKHWLRLPNGGGSR